MFAIHRSRTGILPVHRAGGVCAPGPVGFPAFGGGACRRSILWLSWRRSRAIFWSSAPAAAVHPRPAARTTRLLHSHLLLIRRRRGQVRGDQDEGGRVLALSCAPEGRPDAAAAAVMLAGLLPWRGLAWLGLHVRDGDQHFTLLVAVAAQHTLSFSVSRGMWCRCSWRTRCWNYGFYGRES